MDQTDSNRLPPERDGDHFSLPAFFTDAYKNGALTAIKDHPGEAALTAVGVAAFATAAIVSSRGQVLESIASDTAKDQLSSAIEAAIAPSGESAPGAFNLMKIVNLPLWQKGAAGAAGSFGLLDAYKHGFHTLNQHDNGRSLHSRLDGLSTSASAPAEPISQAMFKPAVSSDPSRIAIFQDRFGPLTVSTQTLVDKPSSIKT